MYTSASACRVVSFKFEHYHKSSFWIIPNEYEFEDFAIVWEKNSIFNHIIISEHPKIKLFITQGGLQSTDEAITAGVPLIGVPMLGDQWFNTEQYVRHNIGVKLSIETLTEKQLKDAIETVVNNER